MGYRNLQETVAALERRGDLRRVDAEVDPRLEVGAIQRRVYRSGGPALLFTRVRGTGFPLLGNLFGTLERARCLSIVDHIQTDLKLDGFASPAVAMIRAGIMNG